MWRSYSIPSKYLLYGVILFNVVLSGPGWAQTEQEQLVTKAQTTFHDFKADPKMKWLFKQLGEAKAILIAPSVVKAGFIFGGSGGHAVLLARDKQTGKWVGPAFCTLATVSAGFQAGVEVSDVVMLVMTEKGLDSLLRTSFKLGADASVALGAIGVGAESTVMADMVAFSHAQGVYGGINADGTMIKENEAWNHGYYKKSVTPADIIVRGVAHNPQADHLLSTITAAAK